MEAKCTSSNREMILYVLQKETGAQVRYGFSPTFVCTVGTFTLTRDGKISSQTREPRIFSILASLGLCDFPYTPAPPVQGDFFYSMEPHSGTTLTNLLCMVSARQYLISAAIGCPGAFSVDSSLILRLQNHPPVTRAEFLQALYGSRQLCRGIRFDPSYIRLTGFKRSKTVEAPLCRQLADQMIQIALTKNWIKPFTTNIHNKKYAMHTLLNAIGMRGEAYAEARLAFTRSLSGNTAYKKMKNRTEAVNG